MFSHIINYPTKEIPLMAAYYSTTWACHHLFNHFSISVQLLVIFFLIEQTLLLWTMCVRLSTLAFFF